MISKQAASHQQAGRKQASQARYYARHGDAESFVRDVFASVGIEIGGKAKQDIQVHDRRFYSRILRDGPLGMGEAYMDGWWDGEAIDDTITRLLVRRLEKQIKVSWRAALLVARAKVLNMQNLRRSYEVGQRHYDVGNDLYQAMLDRRMVYTCAYWKGANTLDEAQEAKLELVCRKLGLRPGMSVLDLGCGWGSFAKYAAERYGVRAVGYTISAEQVALGRELCKGLPVDLVHEDYRRAEGAYDAVISIGIMEHVGCKNHRTYMETVDRCLKPDGIAFVHTIAGNASRNLIDPWVHRYIFPNALLPSLAQLGSAIEELFVLEDLHNLGPHYDRTLMAWAANFEQAWPKLQSEYDQRFYLMWRYYLLMSAAMFRSRRAQLYQMVLTRAGTPQPPCRIV